MAGRKSTSRWADEVDDDDFPPSPTPSPVPPPSPGPSSGKKKVRKEKKSEPVAQENERIDVVIKVDPVTGRKVKVTRTFRLEKQMVSVDVVGRKSWTKFGQSKNDPPGPNAYTTVVADDVQMQFLTRDEAGVEQIVEDVSDIAGQLKGKGFVKCRFCQGEHFSAKCPFKESMGLDTTGTSGADDSFGDGNNNTNNSNKKDSESKPGVFVPPAMRGGNRRGETMGSDREPRKDDATIRISNLPESMSDADMQELCGPFGRIERIFLAKDRTSNICKGFAFVTYHHRDNAARAVDGLDGYGYDYLILHAEMSQKRAE